MLRLSAALLLVLLVGLLHIAPCIHAAEDTPVHHDDAASVPVTFGGPNLAPPPAHFLLPHTGAAASAAAATWKPPPPGSRVLVLGSGGLVGRAMTAWLLAHGYEVAEVRNRQHIDLRVPGALDVFSPSFDASGARANVSFVFFLACDVGGSKFMQDRRGRTQLNMLENNMLIYQTVFSWLERHSIPFLFSSTSLVGEPDSYGSLKRVGEVWANSLPQRGLGKVARLWNVYGAEPSAPSWRSHVLADWAAACVRKGEVRSLTAGNELRQFVHADDCAQALGTIMRRFDEVEFVTDVAAATYQQYQLEQQQQQQQRSGSETAAVADAAPSRSSNGWLSMHAVGSVLSSVSSSPSAPAGLRGACPVHFASLDENKQATPRALLQPRVDTPFHKAMWKPAITLQQGIRQLMEYYINMEQQKMQQQQKQELQQHSEQHSNTPALSLSDASATAPLLHVRQPASFVEDEL